MSAHSNSPLLVLDANIFVSAMLNDKGPSWRIVQAWREGRARLVTSETLIQEVEVTLYRPNIHRRLRATPEEIQMLTSELRSIVEPPLVLDRLPVRSRDPKDDAVLACALGAGADYIVTGDADLLVLDGSLKLGALRIVTPADLLRLLGDIAGDDA